jgi:predicted  nucleic acid-binding Zn-ribbon protein
MVQVETSQLTGECNSWREKLRQLRDEFSKDKIKLQDAVSQPLSKEQLQDVEHLHNQFHIQLINIHDLKHAIKAHEHKMSHEMKVHGKLHTETLAEHENLLDQYQHLDSTLQELREEFDSFLSRTS